MANLRRDMDRILRDYGHNVFLRRRDRSLPWTEDVRWVTDEDGNPLLEKHTVRHMHPSSVALSGATQQETEGVVTNVDRVYWFRWDVNPTEGDEVLDFKPSGMPPVQKQETYHIDYAQPMRGNGGRIEFWAAGATRTDPV